MDETPMPNLAAPRIETSKPQLLAGLSVRYRSDTMGGIPAQWQRLHEVGGVPDAIGQVAYGACYNTDDDGNLDYLCGFEVADFTALPKGFGSLRVPAQKYAVFHQPEHISTIRRTFAAIWTTWLPKSGHKVADAPVLERYGAAFDAVTGNGGFEIWVPIER